MNKSIVAILLCVICAGCHSRVTIFDDFVMGSESAVSNANYFGKPPQGWRVVSDGRGRYAPAEGSCIFDNIAEQVRDNPKEAVVSCWRVYEILNPPITPEPQPRHEWEEFKTPEQQYAETMTALGSIHQQIDMLRQSTINSLDALRESLQPKRDLTVTTPYYWVTNDVIRLKNITINCTNVAW